MPFLNITHFHLLLNHVPTVGTAIAVGLLLLSFVRKNDHVTKELAPELWSAVFAASQSIRTELVRLSDTFPAAYSEVFLQE